MMKILLVEDDESVRNIMAKFLLEEDHSVRTAVNGREGLKMLRDLMPELVLTDIKMPEMSGLDFLEQAGKYNIPFVMMTGYADTDVAVRALKAGAWYFILKPVNFFELKSILDRVAGYRHLENELVREKARGLDLFSLEDFSAMLLGISRELSVPVESIQSDLESFGRALIGLRTDCAAAQEMPMREFRARLDGSLSCLAALLGPVGDGARNLSNVVKAMNVPSPDIRAVHWSEIALADAMKEAMRLAEVGEQSGVLLSLERGIRVLADKDNFALLLGRILRALFRKIRIGPLMKLIVSAQRLENEVLLTISVTGARPRNTNVKDPRSETPGEGAMAGREAFEFMALRGAASAMGGQLSLTHPAAGSVEYALRLMPAMDHAITETHPAPMISGDRV